MANSDYPSGLWPAKHAHGGRLIARFYKSGGTVYQGDAVKMATDGDLIAAATGDTIMGVAANYASVDEADLWVYDDPAVIFMVQHDGTPAQIDMGQLYDHTDPTGDTVTLRSKHELQTSTATDGSATFRMLDKVDRPDNDWGEFVDVYVEIVEHQRQRKYDSALAGI